MSAVAAEERGDEARKAQDGSSGRALSAGYGGGDAMPLAAYAQLLGLYHAAFLGFLLAARKRGQPLPERLGAADLLLLGVATYKLSRLVTKDIVTSPLRAPFARYEGRSDIPSEVNEKPRGKGMQQAIGELFTWPWCMGPWMGAFLTYGFVLWPRSTRLVASLLAANTLSDFLQVAYEAAHAAKK